MTLEKQLKFEFMKEEHRAENIKYWKETLKEDALISGTFLLLTGAVAVAGCCMYYLNKIL